MTTGMSFDVDLPASVDRPSPKTVPHMNLPAHPTEDEATVPNTSLSTEELQQVTSQNPQSANAQKVHDQLTAQAVDTCEGQHVEQLKCPVTFSTALSPLLMSFILQLPCLLQQGREQGRCKDQCKTTCRKRGATQNLRPHKRKPR